MQQHHILLDVPKILTAHNETLLFTCAFETIYDELVNETYEREVRLIPTEYVDINKSLVKDAISEKEKAENIKAIVEKSQKKSFFARLLDFFGL